MMETEQQFVSHQLDVKLKPPIHLLQSLVDEFGLVIGSDEYAALYIWLANIKKASTIAGSVAGLEMSVTEWVGLRESGGSMEQANVKVLRLLAEKGLLKLMFTYQDGSKLVYPLEPVTAE